MYLRKRADWVIFFEAYVETYHGLTYNLLNFFLKIVVIKPTNWTWFYSHCVKNLVI